MLIDAYRILGYLKCGEEHVFSKPLSTVAILYPGSKEDQIQRARDFCQMRGYEYKTGLPTREILEKLNLKDVADKLEGAVAVSKFADKLDQTIAANAPPDFNSPKQKLEELY
jgi:hypothetical protein